MPARIFKPARVGAAGSGIPENRWLESADNASFLRGAPVVATTGVVDECGADPAAICGIANENATTGPGYLAANSPTVVTNRQQRTSVTLVNRTTVFSGRLVNNSDVTITPVTADRWASYGITKQTSGWAVDKNKTGASARVQVVAIDIANKVVFFKVLEANLQAI